MATKTPEDTITFLIACIETAEKIDWKAVAENTGFYKAAKFSKQGYDNIKKKYAVKEGEFAAPKVEKPTTKAKVGGKRKANGTEAKTGSKKQKKKADVEAGADAEDESDEVKAGDESEAVQDDGEELPNGDEA